MPCCICSMRDFGTRSSLMPVLFRTLEPFQSLRNQGMIVARSFQRADGGYVEPEQVQEKQGKYYTARPEKS